MKPAGDPETGLLKLAQASRRGRIEICGESRREKATGQAEKKRIILCQVTIKDDFRRSSETGQM